MQNITTELPIGFSILCFLIGIIFTFFLYKKHTFEGKSWLPIVMAFLRFIVVSILAFFLLEPFVSSLLIDKEKPTGIKGGFINSIHLCSSMGVSNKIITKSI